MRTGILIFGAIYFSYGLLLLTIFQRILRLYEQFDAKIPAVTFLTPIGVILFGLIQLVVYFLKFKKGIIYKILFWLDILILIFGSGLFVFSTILPIYRLTTSL